MKRHIFLAFGYRIFCISKQNWSTSLFIILYPIIIPALLVYYRTLGKKSFEPTSIPSPLNRNELLSAISIVEYNPVCVCPNDANTRTLMNEVHRVISMSVPFGPVVFKNNPAEMIDHMRVAMSTISNNTEGYGIQFEQLSARSLVYTVRSVKGESWFTSQRFPIQMVPGPMNSGKFYIEKGFVPLQIAINEAYSRIFVNVTNTFNWTMQPFPYPPYEKKEDKQIFTKEMAICTGIIIVLVPFSARLSMEKYTGVREMLRMYGVNSWILFGSWIFVYLVIAFIIAVGITILWVYPLENGAILPNTNPVMFVIILVVYYAASLGIVAFISSFISDPITAQFSLLFYYILTSFLSKIVLAVIRNRVVLVLIAMVPNGAIIGILEAIDVYEVGGMEATFTNVFATPPWPIEILPIGINLIIMLVSMFLYVLMAEYVNAVKPGQYGRAKPWYFIFDKCFHSPTQAPETYTLSREESNMKHRIEQVQEGTPVGLESVNLVKLFGPLKAVDHLNIKIYKNQITALLGHNGAGKSTLFSMICGICSPTEGNVYAYTNSEKYDIFQGNNVYRFRKDLGFCPQHDVLMPELTVQQHLIFFGMLKGLTFKRAKEQSDYWSKKFDIYESRFKLVSKLSGGMKRKLCISLALLGDPNFILLDEPTSGLDPESRRDIWDILLTIRGDRTILISTHFMEEADILGDRIAIMANGKLRCYGTGMFLKRRYGSGYQLDVNMRRRRSSEMMNLIKRIIPSSKVIDKTNSSLSVGLPASEVERFPDLFKTIENNFDKQVDISLSCSTMNDVFIKVQEDEGVQIKIDEDNMPTMIRAIQERRELRSIPSRFCQQTQGFLIKRVTWAFKNWVSLFLFLLLLPIIGTLIGILTYNMTTQTMNSVSNLSLTLNYYGDSIAFIAKNPESNLLSSSFEAAVTTKNVIYREVKQNESVVSALLNSARSDLTTYRTRMIVSFDTRKTLNALYSTLAYHSAPIAYGILSNAILQAANSMSSISTYNFPYTLEEKACSPVDPNKIFMSFGLIFVTFLTIATSYFIVFPQTERLTGVKHLQLMTGVHPTQYWITHMIIDLSIFTISVALIVIVLLLLDTYTLITRHLVLLVFTLVLILFGISTIAFAYFCSCFFKSYASSMALYLYAMVAFAGVNALCRYFEKFTWSMYGLYLVPLVPFIICLSQIIGWSLNVSNCFSCDILPDESCKVMLNDATIKDFHMDTELVYLGIDCILYTLIIVLIDCGIIGRMMKQITHQKIEESRDQVDSDVISEQKFVEETRDLNRKYSTGSEPIFVCDDLGKRFSKKIVAVYGVSFAIKEGECFGLLGVNGAGKSTTFGMLTGYLTPSKGDARVLRFRMLHSRRNYLKRLGYCPQFNGLLLELSARTLLQHFGRLRGIPPSELPSITQKWIDALDMTDICDRPCKNYSGGNKRKLSTALALIGDPPVVLLDEPTTGVDPVVRKKVWLILKYCQNRNKQTFIVTSHSMEECEAVCGRLTIMVKGQMRCIGTAPRLKILHGRGYTLLVKLTSSFTDAESEMIRTKIEQSFRPNIKLESQRHGLFTFFINSSNVTIHYAFEVMINLKSSYSVIEEFFLSNVSLESVFLSFAKKT